MTGFRESVGGAGHVPAPATLELGPAAFSPTWRSRPKSAIVFGLRVPSERDLQSARAEAAKQAAQLVADLNDPDVTIDTFNDALLSQLVSYAICDPSNVEAVHPVLEFPQDQVQEYLTSNTIRRIFDEVERLQVATSPLFPEADAADIIELIGLLQANRLGDVDAVTARRTRRFLRFVLDELRPTDA
jgi:hypothetical protein